MTLDEAIKHAEEVAESRCDKCGEEHKQLAVWLRDYKRLLKQEPCDDSISRKDIQDYIAKYLSQYLYEDVRQAVEVIDAYIGDMPSVTQKSGKWIDVGAFYKHECSVCGNSAFGNHRFDEELTDYCPNCGAKMESESDT